MSNTVLILATRYDASTSRTFQWAQELQREMFQYVDNCLLLDVTGLCRGGRALDDLVKVADHVVFYGHGEKDQWAALPGNDGSALIDTNTVTLLDKRNVYAGCCWSLNGLGQAFANRSSSGDYLGYDNQFGFEAENEAEFKKIVNQSVVNFVNWGSATKVLSDLQQQWKRLSSDFTHGTLNTRPNAVQAGHLADLNSQRVGKKP